MESGHTSTYRNRVLSSLTPSDIKRLAPHLSSETFELNRTLQPSGEQIKDIYFVEEGICSIMVNLEDGKTIEVGVIGRDGLVGHSAILDTGQSPTRGIIQMAGSGFSVKAKILREQSENSSTLRACLNRAVQGLLVQTAQTAACNRAHEIEERLARRILTCHDRVQPDRPLGRPGKCCPKAANTSVIKISPA